MTQPAEVLIYGAGGHGKVVADILERQPEYRLAGFLDDNPGLWGEEIFGYKVLGGLDTLRDIDPARYLIVAAVGDNRGRRELVARLDAFGCRYARAIHPSAQIARDVSIGPGSMIVARAVINPSSRIGSHVIVNTGAIIEHDCTIGDFVHVSPASAMAGNVNIGEASHIGMGCSVLPGINIGADCIIGAGSVVNRDIEGGITAVGVPARPIKTG